MLALIRDGFENYLKCANFRFNFRSFPRTIGVLLWIVEKKNYIKQRDLPKYHYSSKGWGDEQSSPKRWISIHHFHRHWSESVKRTERTRLSLSVTLDDIKIENN